MCGGQALVLAVQGEAHGAVEHELGCGLRDGWSAKAAPARISHTVSGSLATTNHEANGEHGKGILVHV